MLPAPATISVPSLRLYTPLATPRTSLFHHHPAIAPLVMGPTAQEDMLGAFRYHQQANENRSARLPRPPASPMLKNAPHQTAN
jgi:hypothetical protein